MNRSFLIVIVACLQSTGWAEEVEASDGGAAWKARAVRSIQVADRLPDQRNVWGGDSGAKVAQPGYFRVQRVKDVWWLIDPAGCRFISVGVNSVDPDRVDSDGGDEWARATRDLLVGAGFNTLSRWSDRETFRMAGIELPWCSTLSFMKSYARDRPRTNGSKGFPNETIPVFDPEWPGFCVRYAKQHAGPLTEDRSLLGHFSDNELPFRPDALARYLSLPESDAGHRAALEWMKANGLDRARADDDPTQRKFLEFVSSRYFGTVAAALKAADPNHLYLGSRLHGRCINEAVIRGAKSCDVVSVNYYHRWTPEPAKMADWTEWSGRPVLVSEFYAMKVENRKTKAEGAGFRVLDHQDAGKFYQMFTSELLREVPNCVGWHWFKYSDDVPEWQKGIVGTDGVAHGALLDAMGPVNLRVYGLRR